MPQIEVTFDIDANGIVNVSAKDKASGKEQQIRIQASGGLSEADIKRMVREAEQHAAEDKKRRELVEARNQADATIYAAEKQLQESGSKVGEADRKATEDAMAALREAVSGEDAERIQQSQQALAQALARFNEAVQRAGAGAESPRTAAGNGAAPGGQDDVVDAEFEDVNDPKRRHG
jgi:molecular chaperone DnaK